MTGLSEVMGYIVLLIIVGSLFLIHYTNICGSPHLGRISTDYLNLPLHWHNVGYRTDYEWLSI